MASFSLPSTLALFANVTEGKLAVPFSMLAILPTPPFASLTPAPYTDNIASRLGTFCASRTPGKSVARWLDAPAGTPSKHDLIFSSADAGAPEGLQRSRITRAESSAAIV